MRKISLVAFTSALMFSGAALAQDNLVTVDLSSIGVDLAGELNIDIDDVPESIELSADLAAAVCDLDVETIGDSCVAVMTTSDLVTALEEDDGDDDGDADEGPSANSAREFAPGQQDGPAKDFAPGQQDGDAKDSAPGQMKKEAGGE